MNTEVTWNDQSLADAIIQKCEGMSIKIFPDTATQIAQEIRSSCEGSDIIAVTAAVKQAISNLLNLNDDNSVKVGKLDNLIKKISTIQNKYAQGEIDDIQARAQVHGIMLPAQNVLRQETIDEINAKFDELEAAEAEAKSLHADTIDPAELNRLKEEFDRLTAAHAEAKRDDTVSYVVEENARIAALEADGDYNDELNARKEKKSLYDTKKTEANALKTVILLLDQTYVIIDTEFYSPETKRDQSGFRKDYFKNVLSGIKLTKSFYNTVRKGILVPDPTEFEKHEFRYLSRAATTRGVQSTEVDPNKMSINLDEFKESESYRVLKEDPRWQLSDEKIEEIVNNINVQPDTWQKGQLIFTLMDPPSQVDTMTNVVTVNSPPPEDQKGVAPSRQIQYNQSLHRPVEELLELIEGSAVGEMLTKVDSSGKQYWTDGRKRSESNDRSMHWVYLAALSSEGLQDRYGRIAHDKYIESLPPEIVAIVDRDLPSSHDADYEAQFNELNDADKRDTEIKNRVLDKADEYAKNNLVNSKNVINNVIHNVNTPSWMLMKLMNTLSDLELREAANKMLRVRKIFPLELEGGRVIKDPQGNVVRDAEGNSSTKPDYERDGYGNVIFDISNAEMPPDPMAQGNARLGLKKHSQVAGNPQVDSIKTQMSNNDTQVESLKNQINQIQQRNEGLRKNIESLTGQDEQAQMSSQPATPPAAPTPAPMGAAPLAPMAKYKVVYKKNA